MATRTAGELMKKVLKRTAAQSLARAMAGAVLAGAVYAAPAGLFVTAAHADASPAEKVKFALSGYHVTATGEQLEAMAGGADELIRILIALRTLETPPFVGIRAEKLLLTYADRPEVSAVLESDLRSTELAGLARIIPAHLDKVPSAAVRRSLARVALDRAASDGSFVPYAKGLLSSQDTEVQQMARSLK